MALWPMISLSPGILAICNYTHLNEHLKRDCVSHKYETRNNVAHFLNIPDSKRRLNQRFLTYLAPKFYNEIPATIKAITRKKHFNVKIKEFVCGNINLFLKYL